MTTTERVYRAVCELCDERGLPATVREVQQRAGLASSSTAMHHILKLQLDGRIRREAAVARSIRPANW